MSDTIDKQHRPAADRILVIDDSPIIREMLREVLTDTGYVVDTADDGEKGTVAALQNDYAVILCDVHMPRRNGLETVRAILAAKPHSRIVMTDSFPDKLAQSARAEGAVCCLQKPFDVTELRDVVSRVKSTGAVTLGR